MRPRDTAPEAWAAQRECWRRMGPERRAELALEMSEEARAISLTGIRTRKPELTESEARRELLVTIYGPALVESAWPRAGATRA